MLKNQIIRLVVLIFVAFGTSVIISTVLGNLFPNHPPIRVIACAAWGIYLGWNWNKFCDRHGLLVD